MMKRKKVVMWIVLITLSLLPCVGFGTMNSGFEMKSIDFTTFFSNYKQNQNCEWGRKAAVYQQQIYYSDPANGGIFRMDLDGSQCQLALEGPDIRKLQISLEGIYYLGFVGDVGNKNDEYRSFRLFFFDSITKETTNLMETSSYSDLSKEAYRYSGVESKNLELWDFFRTEQGIIANWSVSSAPAGPGRATDWFASSLYCTSPEEAIPYSDFTLLGGFPLDQRDIEPTHRESGHSEVAAYDQLFFSAESQNWFVSVNKYADAWESFSVTDQNKNQLVINTDTIYRLYGQVSRHRTIDGFHQGGVLAHVGNEMMLMADDFQDLLRSATLEGEDAIRFVVVSGETAYIIAEKESRDKRQAVYEMDLETFAYQKRYTCAQSEKFLWVETKEEEQILWLDPKKLVTAQGKTIRVWMLENGEYQLNRTLETSQNVVDKINKTDVAGDWLFVYRFNEKENRDELVEKVNIAAE